MAALVFVQLAPSQRADEPVAAKGPHRRGVRERMMAARRFIASSSLVLVMLGACTSKDERATAAAGIATDAFQQGDLKTAQMQIGRALAARDDVSEYWLLSGRIALAAGNYAGAFDSFESALALDQGNVEALTRLCQLAANSDQPEHAQRYAAKLVALRPGDKAALSVEAAIALGHGDAPTAARLIDQILAANPGDATALIIRSRLLSAYGDFAGAARAAETALAAPGDPAGRLGVLRQAYLKLGDAAGYRRTVARLARVAPKSPDAQIDYAQSLYDTGDRAAAFTVTQRILAFRPGNVAVADAVLSLWLAQGAAAMPVDVIVVSAANAVPETKAAFAGYANVIGRPDLALQALGDAGAVGQSPGIAVNDAMVARARAEMLLGKTGAAVAGVAAVLAADPDHPRALEVRGELRAAGGDRPGAVEDLRHALAANPANAPARLALVDLQVAMGDAVLASETLIDGLRSNSDTKAGIPGRRPDPRLATRLAGILRTQGHGAEADAVLENYVRNNIFAPRPPG